MSPCLHVKTLFLHTDLLYSFLQVEGSCAQDEALLSPLSSRGDSVEICLNASGTAQILNRPRPLLLHPSCTALYWQQSAETRLLRQPGELHQFLLISLSRRFIEKSLNAATAPLLPLLEQFLKQTPSRSTALFYPMNLEHRQLLQYLQQPPALTACHPLWFQARALDLVTLFFFQQQAVNPRKERQRELNLERVEQMKQSIRQNLCSPPSLAQIGQQLGVNHFHLSRIFSSLTGMSVPAFIRQARIEESARLLREGKHNVTEAAFSVGYQSLGHFSQAFSEIMGCAPSQYPQALHTGTLPELRPGATRGDNPKAIP